MKTLTFFNNKGGVGKTSLVYHLAWMFGDLGKRVLVADLDPQANLSAAFLDEDRLEALWADDRRTGTIFGSLNPIIRNIGDFAPPNTEAISERLFLLPGDLYLSRFEDSLSEVWPKCLDRDERAFRVTSAFWRIVASAATETEADLVFIDVGPNLGAINRAALIASDHVVVPLAPDLFSLQGLRNLGPTLQTWREGWRERRQRNPDPDLRLPLGGMAPIGYIVLQHAERLSQPIKAYDRWVKRIPSEYRTSVLGERSLEEATVASDPNCLALLKHYRSLMPLAHDARKPIFHLQSADGAIGSHAKNATEAGKQFHALAEKIAQAIDTSL